MHRSSSYIVNNGLTSMQNFSQHVSYRNIVVADKVIVTTIKHWYVLRMLTNENNVIIKIILNHIISTVYIFLKVHNWIYILSLKTVMWYLRGTMFLQPSLYLIGTQQETDGTEVIIKLYIQQNIPFEMPCCTIPSILRSLYLEKMNLTSHTKVIHFIKQSCL